MNCGPKPLPLCKRLHPGPNGCLEFQGGHTKDGSIRGYGCE